MFDVIVEITADQKSVRVTLTFDGRALAPSEALRQQIETQVRSNLRLDEVNAA